MGSSFPQEIQTLLPLLKDLNRQEKLFLIQFLAAELAQQEGSTLTANVQYPVWSPYASYEAGNVLLNLLNEPPAEDYE